MVKHKLGEENINKQRGFRIKSLRKKRGWTQPDLAKRIGRSKGMISMYENGEGLSLEVLNRLAEIFDVSKSFILGDDTDIDDPGKFNGNLYVKTNIMMVPMVQQYAYAGYMGGYSDEEYIEELPKFPFPVEDRSFKGQYMAFEVKGDSMDDGTNKGYRNGVIVLGRQIDQHHWRNKLHIDKWDFVIVHRTDGILIKRIIDHNVNSGILTLHSLNEYYEDFQVHLDEVVQIFNVIKSVSDMRR